MNGEENTNGLHTSGHYDPDMFDVRGSLRSIGEATRHHKRIVLLTCAFLLGIVTLYIRLWPPIYRAEAKIVAEKDVDTPRDNFYIGWNMFRKDDPKTEIELMTVGPVLKEVIAKNHLTYDDVYHPFFSHLSYLWQTSWPGRHYHAFKLKLSPDKDALSPKDLDLARTMADMSAGISIEPVAESNVGKVTVKGPSRRVAQIANSLIDVYLERRAERHYGEAGDSYEVLAKQAAEAGAYFNEVAARRVTLAAERGVTLNFQKETLQVGKLAELELDIAGYRAKAAAVEASLTEIERQLETEPTTKVVSTTHALNEVRETAKHKRLELETQLLRSRDHFREDSPEIQEIKNDMAKLDAIIDREPEQIEAGKSDALNLVRQEMVTKRNSLRSDLEGSHAALAVMEQTAAQLRNHLQGLPAMQAKMAALDEEYLIAKNTYQSLTEKKTQAAVSQMTTKEIMPSLRVVDYASPPSEPYWPTLKYLYPGTLLVGLIVGVGAAVLRDYTSGRISREHVERGRGAVPLYGTIPVAATAGPLRAVAAAPRARAAVASSGGSFERKA